MNYDQFKNLSCCEEFEIQCDLLGVSKIDVLKEIGHRIDDYYFFISANGIFNWFDLNGNHIENPGVLKELTKEHISRNITKCIIPNSVTSIGNDVFCNCILLQKITIPNSVTSIGKFAFYDCESLKEITIPDSVTSINGYAFAYCYSLKEITIPDSVTRIGYSAFYFCESLTQVVFKGKTLEEVKQMENYPFRIKDERIIKCEK